MAIVILLFAAIFTVAGICISHKVLEEKVDRLCMQSAVFMNRSDQIGQMNNLQAYSRELVFDARRNYNRACDLRPDLSKLANLTLEQSRAGAKALQIENRRIIAQTFSKLDALFQQSQRNEPEGTILPWLRQDKLKIDQAELGYPASAISNVPLTQNDPELASFDRNHRFYDEKTGFYFGNQNVFLPGPDDDLTFPISRITPVLQNTVTPARLCTSNETTTGVSLFRDLTKTQSQCLYQPTTILCKVKTTLTSSLTVPFSDSICAQGVATAGGAQTMP